MQLLRPSKRSFKLFLVPTKQTEAVDDYLKAILELSGPQETRVSSNALAARLGVRAASVTGMLQKLATRRPSLVLYEKHHGVRLTVAGKRRAWEIVRHHRLLELFLHDVLKYSWDEVHEEAGRLEHFISERFVGGRRSEERQRLSDGAHRGAQGTDPSEQRIGQPCLGGSRLTGAHFGRGCGRRPGFSRHFIVIRSLAAPFRRQAGR